MAGEGPRFRRDLDARPIEIDGIAYVEATDPRSGNQFRFYEFELAVAEVLDGRALGDVVIEVRAKSGYEITREQLDQFIDKLRELGFLEATSGLGAPGSGLGDDDATLAGPPPAGILESTRPAPAQAEVAAESVWSPAESAADAAEGEEDEGELEPPLIPQGSTEKLQVIGSTERLPVLDPRAPTPSEEVPPVADPALAPRSGELGAQPAPPAIAPSAEPGAQPAPRTITPSAELELAPPGEASVVAADLDEDTTADLPGSEDPTKIERLSDERRRDDHKNTLFGLPFHEVDRIATAARAATPTPVVIKDEPPTKEVVPLAVQQAAKTTELAPLEAASAEVTTETAGPPPAEVTAASEPPAPPEPAVPFPPTPSVLTVAPFPPSATPAPQKDLPGSSIEHPALTLSTELPAVAPPTPKPRPVRLSPILFAAAGVMLAGLIGFYGFRWSSTSEPGPIAVRTVSPVSGSTYRWFDAAGTIKAGGDHALTFTSGGKVIRVLPAGTAFRAGDVIAEIEGGAGPYKQALEHNRQRLAYYEQHLEQMKAENNRPEIHQAELKIAEKKRLIAEAQANLSKQGVVANAPGEVAEVVATPGTVVKPGDPAVRTKGNEARAEFELSRDDAERARHLGFCQLEVQGKQYDCSLSAEGGDETHVLVDLPADAGIPTDKPIHLAKARYDGVFVLPATALAPTKGSDRRVYVVKDGRAESYAVVLADQTPTEIVVTQGLEPGSAVVAEVPRDLRPRAVVKIASK